jgi:predicted ABC-type transport system involved in lysophospholipase L1 biosynthesis ATPase subunit
MDKGLLDPSGHQDYGSPSNRRTSSTKSPVFLNNSTLPYSNGRSLSSGQRQRLAPARAFLSRSQLILIDEPTAHLDRADDCCRRAASLLVVAYRPSTVTNADQILVSSALSGPINRHPH